MISLQVFIYIGKAFSCLKWLLMNSAWKTELNAILRSSFLSWNFFPKKSSKAVYSLNIIIKNFLKNPIQTKKTVKLKLVFVADSLVFHTKCCIIPNKNFPEINEAPGTCSWDVILSHMHFSVEILNFREDYVCKKMPSYLEKFCFWKLYYSVEFIRSHSVKYILKEQKRDVVNNVHVYSRMT